MLNKPTNVSPYNEFIDINNGLELNFSLNNTVDTLSVNIYKDDNSIMGSELINNTSLSRDFSYTVPEDVLINITNGNNYYWKTRFWKIPLQENKIKDFHINYWNEQDGIVGGVYFPESGGIEIYDKDNDSYLIYGGTILSIANGTTSTDIGFKMSQQLSSYWADLIYKIGNYSNVYLYFYTDSAFGYARISVASTINENGYRYVSLFSSYNEMYISTIGVADTVSSTVVKSEMQQFIGTSPNLFLFETEDLPFKVGDYIYFCYQDKDNQYRIQTVKSEVYDNIPIIKLSVSPSMFGLPSEQNEGRIQSGIVSAIYKKAEYNESPPYYFSCREAPEIELYDVSTNIPQIQIYANLKRYIDINSYYYQVYHLDNHNNWTVLWQSENLSSYTSLNDGTFDTEKIIYSGITPQNTYKIKLIGQTTEGMDFEAEKLFLSEDFSPTEVVDFVSFNRDFGCVEVNNAAFMAPTETCELQIYRYDILKNELNYVSTSSYSYNTTVEESEYRKRTITYDFNIVSEAEYIYYAYIIEDGIIVSSYISSLIVPRWSGVYLTDVTYNDSITYTPDISKVWYIELNYEPKEVTRNYQLSHPHGIGQKYPKSVRGTSNFKTGQVSGLLGNVSCTSGEYEESLYLIEDFDSFCANGKLKLLRSSVKGEQLIADIDKMGSIEYGQVATSVNLSYTQIDDITKKQISIEV